VQPVDPPSDRRWAGTLDRDLEVTDVKALARAKTEIKKPEPKAKHDPRHDVKRPDLKRPPEPKKPLEREKALFASGDLVVYPTHGVGKILGIERQEIAGLSINVFVVHFDKDRMTLRVPVTKAPVSGLRRLSSRKEMDAALTRLKGRSRAKRTMWSRRAQEYEAKINSGDPASIAEVVRDLYRNTGQPEQSYSERQIYQAALDRLVREFAAVEKIDEPTAVRRLEQMLSAA
jgi:CarD family transcriptional regulator